jgi:hypothetical protein
VPANWARVVLVKYGICRKVVGYGKQYSKGDAIFSCVEAWRAAGGADVVGGRDGGSSDKRVSRHQKLYLHSSAGVRPFTREQALTGKTIRNPQYPVLST